MLLVEETAPAQASLPVAALRGHLRMGSGFELVEDAAEDAALAGFLRAAIATVEARTGLLHSVDDAFAFITRELTDNALSIPGGRW